LKKKAFRVTYPQGEQRSTYFLSLPAHYAVPLLAFFIAMHYTLSQGLSVTVVETYELEGQSIANGMPLLVQNGKALMISKFFTLS
jgi:hypothetical protein